MDEAEDYEGVRSGRMKNNDSCAHHGHTQAAWRQSTWEYAAMTQAYDIMAARLFGHPKIL